MKLVHVHFKKPFQGKDDMYFGSFAAIYENVPREDMGVSMTYLCDTCRINGGFYENKKIIVKVGEFITKKKGKPNE